ncbi:MAG: FG-GAP repeat domain-containing protein, partial [Planctomycetaceae bacterium]
MVARLTALTLAVLLPSLAALAGEFPAFKPVVIDPHAGEIVYAVTLADVDGDGKQDIVAVTENRVLWYRNPDWKQHIIIENQTERDNVCIAPHDIDGDGKIDFALGAGWTKIGTIQWLTRGESLEEDWTVHPIGQIPWTHRMRWADVLGTGTPQLIVSPLNKTEGDGVKLTAFAIPEDPKADPWPQTVLDDSLNRLHNHWHLDINRDGTSETLTASEEGIHVIFKRNSTFQKRQVPDSKGAGEVKAGRLGA